MGFLPVLPHQGHPVFAAEAFRSHAVKKLNRCEADQCIRGPMRIVRHNGPPRLQPAERTDNIWAYRMLARSHDRTGHRHPARTEQHRMASLSDRDTSSSTNQHIATHQNHDGAEHRPRRLRIIQNGNGNHDHLDSKVLVERGLAQIAGGAPAFMITRHPGGRPETSFT